MLKLIKAGKLLAVSGVVLLSSLIPAASASATATATNTDTCYAGRVDTVTKGQDSFKTVWNDDNTFTITVATPLKQKMQFFVSDYVLTSPDYKGGCFKRDASFGTYPQTWYKTETVVLDKGFSGTKTVSVELPTTCENVQVDLYWGKTDSYSGVLPLNSTVDVNGHDKYGYIQGNIMQTAKNPACQPGQGGGETPPVVVTPTPTPAAPVATPAAPTLVDTGLKVSLVSILAAVTAAAAVFVGTRRTKVSE